MGEPRGAPQRDSHPPNQLKLIDKRRSVSMLSSRGLSHAYTNFLSHDREKKKNNGLKHEPQIIQD